MEIFKRSFRLKIQIGSNLKTYQELGFTDKSLKIEFDITMGVAGSMANGNITVFGLTDEDMEYLCSCYDPSRGIFKRNFVSLEVGYIDKLGLILKGNILEIDPNFNTLGNSINLKIMAGVGNNLSNNNISTSLANKVDFKTICNDCAKNNGMTLKFDSKIPKRFINDYSFNGTPFQQIENIRKYYDDVDIFVDGLKDVLNVLKKEGGDIVNKNELSNKTGLVGRPKPTNQGLQVISLLNTNFYAGGFIKLKNERLKSFDGNFRIWEVKHVGSNYGDNWISQLILQKSK